MDETLYKLGVQLSLQMGTLPSQIGSSIGLFQSLERQMLRSARAAGTLGTVMRSLALAGVGLAVASFGFGLIGVLDRSVQKAMQLNTVMLSVQTAIRGTPSQMSSLNVLAQNVGMSNQMSSIQVAQIMQAATGAGITNYGTLKGMTRPLANLSEVLSMTKGMNPTDSAKIAVEFAHMFGARTGQPMVDLTNNLARALFVSPSTPSQFLSTTRQFAGALSPLYGSSPGQRTQFQHDSILMASLMSQMGLGSRGGTEYASALMHTFLAGSPRGGQARSALQTIAKVSGVNFYNSAGQYTGVEPFISALAGFARKEGNHPYLVDSTLYRAFGATGTRGLGLLAEQGSLSWLSSLGNLLFKKGGIASDAQIQKAFNQSPQGQLNQLNANITTIATVLGGPLLKNVAAAAKDFNKIADAIIKYSQRNPGAIDNLVKVLAGLAVLATLGGGLIFIVNVFKALAAIYTTIASKGEIVITVFGALSDFFDALILIGAAIAALPFEAVALIVAGVVVVVGALVYVLTHLHETITAVGNAFSWIGSKIHDFLVMIGFIHDTTGQTIVKKQPAAPYGSVQSTPGDSGTVPGPPLTIKDLHIHVGAGDVSQGHAQGKAAAKGFAKELQKSLWYNPTAPHSLSPGPLGY